MIFKNSIRFKHGTLRRGDKCLYRQWPGVYMGSYIENEHTVHMIKVYAYYGINGNMQIEEYIAQTTNKNDIVCHQQEMEAAENQLRLV